MRLSGFATPARTADETRFKIQRATELQQKSRKKSS